MRPAPCWSAIALLAIAHRAGEAQSVADLERRLLPYRQSALASAVDFWRALTALREQEEQQAALRADIQFGLSGDEAGERSLYKLNTGISVSRGDYPSELSVDSRLGLQLRDGALQEDVTTLRITYDYHANRALQYFAFAERFTDNFLSIQQRYEIGFGARLARKVGFVGNEDSLVARLAAVRGQLVVMHAREANPAALAPADLDRYAAAIDQLEQSIRDSKTKLLIGIAVSAFAEFERASLDVTSLPLGGAASPGDSVRSSIAIPGEQRYRLSIRPTFRWRPTPDVRIQVFPYFKLPLDAPHRVPDATNPAARRYDFRRDVMSEVGWTLRGDQTGLENVEFVVTLNHYLDNAPPKLTAEIIAAELAKGRVFRRTDAERSHRVVAMALRVRW